MASFFLRRIALGISFISNISQSQTYSCWPPSQCTIVSGSTITCNSDTCEISCDGYLSCYLMDIHCNTGTTCNINCSGQESCRETNVYATNAHHLSITVPSTTESYFALYYATIWCPDNGPRGNIPCSINAYDTGVYSLYQFASMTVKAVEGFNDVNIYCAAGSCNIDSAQMQCTENYSESCTVVGSAYTIDRCKSLESTFCETYLLPTSEPTKTQLTTAAQPTTYEPTISQPTTTLEPTSSIPTTTNPTTTFVASSQPSTLVASTFEPTSSFPSTTNPTTKFQPTKERTTMEPTTVQPTAVQPPILLPTSVPTSEPDLITNTSHVPIIVFVLSLVLTALCCIIIAFVIGCFCMCNKKRLEAKHKVIVSPSIDIHDTIHANGELSSPEFIMSPTLPSLPKEQSQIIMSPTLGSSMYKVEGIKIELTNNPSNSQAFHNALKALYVHHSPTNKTNYICH